MPRLNPQGGFKINIFDQIGKLGIVFKTAHRYPSVKPERVRIMKLANYCGECGSNLPKEISKFCTECGAPLPLDGSSRITINESAERGSPTESEPNSTKDDRLADEKQIAFDHFVAPLFTPPGITEGALGWENACRVVTMTASSQWWGGVTYTSKDLLIGKYGEEIAGNHKLEGISQYFTSRNEVLNGFEPITWDESKFGIKFLALLLIGGVETKNFKLGAFTQQSENDDQAKATWWDGKVRDYVFSKWLTGNNFPFCQIGQVYRNQKTGKERVFWFIEALVRTRYSDLDKGIHPSNSTFIPATLQNILYLGETPFPGVVGSMMNLTSRDRAFASEEGESLPIPLIQYSENERVTSLNRNNPEEWFTDMAPEVTRLGYVFDEDMSEEQISSCLTTVTRSLNLAMGILIDAYTNFDEDSPLYLQIAAYSDYYFHNNKPFISLGKLVPGALYGEMCMRSEIEHARVGRILSKAKKNGNQEAILNANEEMFRVAEEGVGSIFLHAENAGAFTLVQLGAGPGKDVMDALMHISRYPWDCQNYNACSNMSLLCINEKFWSSAETILDKALKFRWLNTVATQAGYNSSWWNLKAENAITEEIYVSWFRVKSQLGKIDECRAFSKEVVTFCLENQISGELLNLAQTFSD